MKRRNLLSPLSDADYEALMTPTPKTVREPNTVELRYCAVCREWCRAGSLAAGACVDCGTAIKE